MLDIFDSWGYAYAIGLSPVLLPKVALCAGCWHTMQGGYLLLIGIAYVILLGYMSPSAPAQSWWGAFIATDHPSMGTVLG